MTKDGVAFCLGSADLTTSTTAATTFMAKVVTVSEIQNKSGIFSFDLSWSEIQTLKRKEQLNCFFLYSLPKCYVYIYVHPLISCFCSFDQPNLMVHMLRQA
jgi:hypothetical protein